MFIQIFHSGLKYLLHLKQLQQLQRLMNLKRLKNLQMLKHLQRLLWGNLVLLNLSFCLW